MKVTQLDRNRGNVYLQNIANQNKVFTAIETCTFFPTRYSIFPCQTQLLDFIFVAISSHKIDKTNTNVDIKNNIKINKQKIPKVKYLFWPRINNFSLLFWDKFVESFFHLPNYPASNAKPESHLCE